MISAIEARQLETLFHSRTVSTQLNGYPQVDPERRKMVLAAQIIVAALVAGCLFFLLIVVLIVSGKFGNWEFGPSKPITLIALVVAFGILAARIIVPGVVTGQMLRPYAQPGAKEPDWKTCSASIKRP